MKESKHKCETCSICGVVHENENLVELDGKKICPECLSRETIVCSHCGERIWKMDNQGTLNMPLCSNCYDEHYTSCAECGRIIHREDAYYEDGEDEPLCYRCYEDSRGHEYIEDYYYKPEPIFYGEGKRFFGVELEVDNGGEVDDNAAAVMRIGNGNGLEHIYCKHDGSLETKPKKSLSYQEEYIERLKVEAEYCGYSPSLIDTLLEDGYSTDDIEELIYCGAY